MPTLTARTVKIFRPFGRGSVSCVRPEPSFEELRQMVSKAWRGGTVVKEIRSQRKNESRS